MGKFRKKPVVIEAFKWTGDWEQEEDPEWCVDAMKDGTVSIDRRLNGSIWLRINTLEGVMFAARGDWIIRGVKGEIYPCKPDIFEATYEPVKD